MPMSIIISFEDGETTRLEQIPVESESYLQEYISENPESLPLDDYKEDLQLLILDREFPTPSGPIDALGVDQDGEIYVIETKLYKNPDKRRVLAQVIDYGAAMWREYEDPAEFVRKVEAAVTDRYGNTLREKVQESFPVDESEVEDLLQDLRDNVSEGNFRFVVLMDQLQDRLKDLITYMNANSRFDVFGVELEFYRHDGLHILLPNLYGAEVKKNVGESTSSARRTWSEESFFDDAEDRLDGSDVANISRLYEWSTEHADQVSWGTGAKRGSFNPKFNHVSNRSVFSVFSNGELQLNFGWLTKPEHSQQYAEKLRLTLDEEMEDISVPQDLDRNYPSVAVEDWAPRVDELIEVFEEVLLDTNHQPKAG